MAMCGLERTFWSAEFAVLGFQYEAATWLGHAAEPLDASIMHGDDYPHFFLVAAKIRITDGQAIIDAARRDIVAFQQKNPDDDLLASQLQDIDGDPATALGWLLSTMRAEFVTNDGFLVEDASGRYSYGPERPEWWPDS
jgi:hypothetical protein